jgi:hypothetical protein
MSVMPGIAPAPSADEAAVAPGRLAGWHPVLFAAYPILFLWSQNLGEVDPLDALIPLLVATVAAFAVTWLLGRVLGDVRRAALIATPLAIGLLLYGHADNALHGTPIRSGLQQVGWLVVVGASVIAAVRLPLRWVRPLDSLLLAIGSVLVGFSLISILPFQVGAAVASGDDRPADRDPVGSSTTAQRRDVYWLVYDRYGSDRSLESRFGDAGDLTDGLRALGFTVLDESHANYVRTSFSMASTLNLTHFDELAASRGPDDRDIAVVNRMIQDSLVARQFKALGYRYTHIGSWWDPTRSDSAADVNLNLPGASDFVDSLYDETAFPALARRLGLTRDGPGGPYRHFDHNVFALDALDEVRSDPGPKFVHAHLLLPHKPYVFDRDGTFIGESDLPESDLHAQQLAYANSRIRAFVEPLLRLPPDEQPIIIIQADEGPYTERYAADLDGFDWTGATPEELEQKFGILNAWYVPAGAAVDLYPSMTAINTFPVLFRDYFGLDYEPLPDVVYAANEGRPYDLLDITDLLPSLP